MRQAFLLFFLLFQIDAAERPSRSQEIVEYVRKNLPMMGEICCSPNGFVFVKVDDDYVHKCIQFIEEECEVPPYFGELYTSGAHITIAYPEEWAKGAFPLISELGESVAFEILGCQILETHKSPLFERVWVLLVDAPSLYHLREKYGLLKVPFFPFHITICGKLRQQEPNDF